MKKGRHASAHSVSVFFAGGCGQKFVFLVAANLHAKKVKTSWIGLPNEATSELANSNPSGWLPLSVTINEPESPGPAMSVKPI